MDKTDSLKLEYFSSLLKFIRDFYELKNGRPFLTPEPIGRESHYKTICVELELVFDLKTNRLMINIPPGFGKSTLCVYFVAWALAQYPDAQIMYISYSHELAEKHTATIKEIMQLPAYGKLFDVYLSSDTKAKGDFATTKGGRVKAYGSSGTITGMDAGLPGLERFSGLVIMDDMHKPDEVHSDTMRDSVIRNYQETIANRPRADNVPMISIGQRLHEGDISNFLLKGLDIKAWTPIILKGLDDAGNALCHELKSLKTLLAMKEKSPYVFASQIQQDPIPAGGALYKTEDFIQVDNAEIKILATFMTCDTAETDKSYNDATVFSFWGLYKIDYKGYESEEYALQWLDCTEERIEPKDLQNEFYNFYTRCMRHSVKPTCVAIEKKSTGVTLLSSLKATPGIKIIDIERTKASGSKTTRFLEIQPHIGKRLVTFPVGAKHFKLCVEHMTKITANDSHRFDDIADTCYDAIKLAIIDKALGANQHKENEVMRQLAQHQQTINHLKEQRFIGNATYF